MSVKILFFDDGLEGDGTKQIADSANAWILSVVGSVRRHFGIPCLDPEKEKLAGPVEGQLIHEADRQFPGFQLFARAHVP